MIRFRSRYPSHFDVVAIAAVIAIAVCGWISAAEAQTAAGNVTALAGSASLHRAGGIIEVTVGMAVLTADEIAVSEGGRVSITLSDGSIIEAGSASTIVIDQQLLEAAGVRGATRISVLRGILRSVVKHSSHGNPPNFEVHTPNAILAARATMFDTSYSEEPRWFGQSGCSQFTDEQTFKGAVGVKNAATPAAAEVLVEAGYETTVACASPPLPPGPLGVTGIPSTGAGSLTVTEPGAVLASPPPGVGGAVTLPPIGGKGY